MDAVHYCCIYDGKAKQFHYKNGEDQLETLADSWLKNVPPYHSWFFHSIGGRTYGYLMENELVYFVIANSGISSQELLKFLKHVRDGYGRFSNSKQDLVYVIRQLITSAENIPRYSFLEQMSMDRNDRASPIEETKKSLLGWNKHDKKKKKVATDCSSDRDIGICLVPLSAFCSSEKSPSSNHPRNRQTAKKLWLRQVKIIIVVDVLLCLILFVIWLTICKGFKCVQ